MENNERKPMKLNVLNVQKVIKDCLLKESEIKDNEPICDFVIGEGLINTFYFNTERLAQHDEDIVDMIDQLPEIEKGPSFLNLCITTEGVYWGEHRDIEQLVVLGIASGNLDYCLPKEMWSKLPGGMPMVIKVDKTKNKEK